MNGIINKLPEQSTKQLVELSDMCKIMGQFY